MKKPDQYNNSETSKQIACPENAPKAQEKQLGVAAAAQITKTPTDKTNNANVDDSKRKQNPARKPIQPIGKTVPTTISSTEKSLTKTDKKTKAPSKMSTGRKGSTAISNQDDCASSNVSLHLWKRILSTNHNTDEEFWLNDFARGH